MFDTHSSLKNIDPRLVLLIAILGLLNIVSLPARAQSLVVLHSFAGGADGGYPLAGLIRDAHGNLYGTTSERGTYGFGTVFRVKPSGEGTVLYSFTGGAAGAYPVAGLVRDAQGNLYGTTELGGTYYGTVFKITPTGTETVLYSFMGERDGGGPQAGLIQDAQGNLYGTAFAGGSYDYPEGYGTVFKVTSTGTYTVLYTFTGGEDGGYPHARLILDCKGNLYGTTERGGSYDAGTVFEVTPAGTERVLHSFTGGTDGANPVAGLVRDARNNLYGTTYGGGAYGKGAIFKLTAAGTETVLYNFTLGADGGFPSTDLARDAQGNLYGTTGAVLETYGTIFRVTPDGTHTVLYSFTGGDGANPNGPLVGDAHGNLYGTAQGGGAHTYYGTVFKLIP